MRLGGLDQRIDGLEKRLTAAILVLSDNLPGSVTGQRSHVREKVEAALQQGSGIASTKPLAP